MSLISMPPKQVLHSAENSCDPAKAAVSFSRTCDCKGGHNVDSMTYTKSARRLQHLTNTCARFRERKAQEKAEAKTAFMKKRRDEFTEKGLKVAFYGTVETKVKCAAMCTDHILGERRNKLRELLLSEDAAYASEYIALCQQVAAEKEEEVKKKAFDLKTRQERERREFVEQKLLEHKVLNCDTTRPLLSKQKVVQIKRDQIWQIQEKNAKEEAKREEEKMYHDLMIKHITSLKENEEEKAKIRWQKQKELGLVFKEQIDMKERQKLDEVERKALERQQVEEDARLNKEKDQRELEEKLKRNAKATAEFKEFLENERKIREQRKKEEDAVDSAFVQLAQKEMDKEKMKTADDKSRLRREMMAFQENCQELKHQREIEDRKFDEMLQELNNMKLKQKEEEKIRLKMAKEDLFNSVVRGRKEQLREKLEREKREKEASAREIELLQMQIVQQKRIREDYEKRCIEKRKQYARELMEQVHQNEEAIKKEKLEKEEFLKNLKAQDEKVVKEVEEILRLPMDPRPHPMKEVMLNRSPNYLCPFPCTK